MLILDTRMCTAALQQYITQVKRDRCVENLLYPKCSIRHVMPLSNFFYSELIKYKKCPGYDAMQPEILDSYQNLEEGTMP